METVKTRIGGTLVRPFQVTVKRTDDRSSGASENQRSEGFALIQTRRHLDSLHHSLQIRLTWSVVSNSLYFTHPVIFAH